MKSVTTESGFKAVYRRRITEGVLVVLDQLPAPAVGGLTHTTTPSGRAGLDIICPMVRLLFSIKIARLASPYLARRIIGNAISFRTAINLGTRKVRSSCGVGG